MAVSVNHTFVSPVADAGNADEVGPNEWNAAHTVTGLGTAAEANTTDFATAAQGALAATAVQPGSLATVATTGAYADLSGKPTLGTAAATAATDYATAAQGAKADTALQPAAIGVTVQGYDADLTAWAGVNPSSYSTTAQIAAAYQPLDADLTAWAAVNPSSYSTTAQIAAAYQALDADLTSWAGVTRASGFDTFAATPSSTNLRALLSDEVGTGAAYFVSGALGTPASVTLTNGTGLPTAGMLDDAVTNAKLANMADGTFKMGTTGGGDPIDATAVQARAALDSGIMSGFRNRLINGDGAINQRGATSQSDDTYAWDRHYVLTQTAAVGVSTLSDVANGLPSMMRETQSQASAQRMGIAQIIEAANCKDLRGQAVTLLGKLRCSASQAIRYAILEWTGTADAPVSDVVNSWTNATFTAGQFFNSTTLTVTQVGTITPSAATVTDFLLTTTLGSSVNNVIVMIWTEGTAAQNVTLDVAWQFAKGDLTGQTYPVAVRSREDEMALCQRHLVVYGGSNLFEAACVGFVGSTSIANGAFAFPVTMHHAPSLSYSAVGHWVIQYSSSSSVVTAIAINQASAVITSVYFTATGTPLTVSGCVIVLANNTLSARLFFEAEL
jgi:hypothetical protein